MELNRELLIKVTDHALSASNWNQRFWVVESPCGTSYCIAGFTAVEFGGWRPVPNPALPGYMGWVTDGNSEKTVPQVARELLGLTLVEANYLFDGHNDADTVRNVTKEILDGKYR